MTNPNYATYLGTATQLQRWRDFLAHAAAYAVFNLAFLAVWAATGRGTFWPAFPLIGWGIGLTFQHHANTWHGPITDTDVREAMRRYPVSGEQHSSAVDRRESSSRSNRSISTADTAAPYPSARPAPSR
jgi:hypothetical protein